MMRKNDSIKIKINDKNKKHEIENRTRKNNRGYQKNPAPSEAEFIGALNRM